MSAHDDATDEPAPDDVERVSAALRATATATGEPDWTQLAAAIGAAVDGEARRQRRRRGLALGGAVLAAAAVAALLVWPRPRGASTVPEVAPPVAVEDEPIDEAMVEELTTPDDLGGITVDEELIEEAAAAALEDELDEADDALDDRLLPDGAWIDELSDDELERAVAILDGEAG